MSDNRPKVFKSKTFVTGPVTAVFPKLNEPDKYGKYSVDVDVLEDPSFEETIIQQAQETLLAGQAKFGTDKQPTNEIVKSGTYEDEPTRRIAFKMSSTRKVKGEQVTQQPRLVDAKKMPMTEEIWGGSTIKIGYYIQYSLLPTGTYLSVRLEAVQVLEHVGASGRPSVDSMFEEVAGGFESSGVTEEEETPNNTNNQEAPSGAEF